MLRETDREFVELCALLPGRFSLCLCSPSICVLAINWWIERILYHVRVFFVSDQLMLASLCTLLESKKDYSIVSRSCLCFHPLQSSVRMRFLSYRCLFVDACVYVAILDDLLSSGQLAGSITGSRTDKAQFVPDIYSRAQNEWVEAFYAQNGYLGELLPLLYV